MVFIETPIFTAQIDAQLSAQEFAEFQVHLAMNPKAGDIWKMVKWQLGGNLGERREGKRKL